MVSAHSGCGHRLDFAYQAHLAGRSIGIFVLPEVFLRERIDMWDGACFGDPPDTATNLDVAVRIAGIDDRKRHRRTLLQVAGLDPSFRGVHANETALVIE